MSQSQLVVRRSVDLSPGLTRVRSPPPAEFLTSPTSIAPFDLDARAPLCAVCRGTGLQRVETTRNVSPDHFRLLQDASGSNDPGLGQGCLNNGYYNRFFQELHLVGRGGFGSVYLCRHVLDQEDLGAYAVKKVPVGDNHRWLVKVLNEVRALERLKHENIVDYKHSWLEAFQPADFGPSVPCLFILMEYADKGNLALIARNGHLLTDAEVMHYFRQVCLGLQHLHHNGILYHDLKPENILLKSCVDSVDGRSRLRVLLSDFGTSASKLQLSRLRRTGTSGTVMYTPPEILAAAESDEGMSVTFEADQKADVWSAGAVLYSLAFGEEPFKVEQGPDSLDLLIQRIRDGEVELPAGRNRSKFVYSLIKDMMRKDPRDRPFIDDVLKHPAMQIDRRVDGMMDKGVHRNCWKRKWCTRMTVGLVPVKLSVCVLGSPTWLRLLSCFALQGQAAALLYSDTTQGTLLLSLILTCTAAVLTGVSLSSSSVARALQIQVVIVDLALHVYAITLTRTPTPHRSSASLLRLPSC